MKTIKYCTLAALLVTLCACNAPQKAQDNSTKAFPALPLPQYPDLTLASGEVKRFEAFPSQHVAARNVDVWLPEGYDSTATYPVLYMHDGAMLFDSTTTWNKQEWGVDETLGQLIEAGETTPCIVVGVWNSGKGRHGDYFPRKAFEKLPQEIQAGMKAKARELESLADDQDPLRADRYLKFLVEELKPFIDSQYATKPGPEDTFVSGSSMGGLISMYAICEYPEVFGGAACLSTHWPGVVGYDIPEIPAAFVEYLSENAPDPASHKLYFDYGTATLDSLYEPHQLRIDSVMRAKGYDESNWTTKKFAGENHSENAWRKRFHLPATFLMQK